MPSPWMKNGHMVSIFDKKHDRELVQAGKAANQLRLYEDKPIYFDNWDIDMYYVGEVLAGG